jgi:hypothetical protein
MQWHFHAPQAVFFVGADERTQGKLNGINADLLVVFTSVAASAPDGSDATNSIYCSMALCGR